MKKLFCLIIFLFLVLSGCGRVMHLPKKEIRLGGQRVFVELASTPEARTKGLSHRKKLCVNCGMLFLFGGPGQYEFWMKDMNFPLDIVWLAGGEIKEISSWVPKPLSGQPVAKVAPSQPVDQVLEIRAGQAQAWGLKPGQKLEQITP